MKLAKTDKASMNTEDLKWQTEDDARTLERAEEIRKDPQRLKAATAHMEAKLEKIKSFVDTMKTRNAGQKQ